MSTSYANFGPATYNDEVVDAFANRVEGRIFLITGPATNGLGDAAARALARGHPAAILLVGRSPAKYTAVEDAIKAVYSNIIVRVYGVDLNSLASVRSGAQAILDENSEKGIDVIINNAGVMRGDLQYTVDGIEEHFQANHVGHFLLTNLLMPLLKKSAEPRVVNVSSGAYAAASGDYSDYNFKKREYTFMAGYAQGKLANVHFSQSLAKRGIPSFSLHPGVILGTSVALDLPRDDGDQLVAESRERGLIFKELSQGASTTLVAALDPEIAQHSGAVLEDCQIVANPAGAGVKREGAAEELWELSERLVGQEFVF